MTPFHCSPSYVEDPSLSASTALDDPVLPGTAPPPTNALVAIVEQGMGGMAYDERVRIGLVSVIPITGDVVWDEFDGGYEFGRADDRWPGPDRAGNAIDAFATCRAALTRNRSEQGDAKGS